MPTWGEILSELSQLRERGIIAFDQIRRRYLTGLYEHTGRNTILYATNWTHPIGMPIDPNTITMADEDIEGLMEVIHGLEGHNLDLILHSPGGSAEAAEAIVSYLRTKFSEIRVFIPHAAMSAATMLSCSANLIVMGRQ
jgi:ClpP class serine protease